MGVHQNDAHSAYGSNSGSGSSKSSPTSIWEAAIKREAGRLRAPRNLTALLATEFRLLAITAALLEQAAELPKHHMDPFDRVLIAHALDDDIEILTRDAAFAAYGVRLAAAARN
jgi:PIN domain nuclease of toxin-antitoxin system